MAYKKKATKRARPSGTSRGLTRKRKSTYSQRKAPPKKRKTTKKKTPMLSPHTAAYLNPFSTLTSQPKIPDGKASESVGVTYRNITEVADNATNGAPTTFLLVPALGYGVCIANDNISGSETWQDSFNALNLREFSTAPGAFFNLNPGLDEPLLAKTEVSFETGGVAHWRLVSMGMRISLLNPVESDDGWYEACQLTYDDNADYWRTIPKNGKIQPNNHFMAPAGHMLLAVGEDVSNERTYKTGLLRDLHKTVWRCMPCKEDHDFQNLTGSVYTNTAEGDFIAADKALTWRKGSVSAKELIEQTIDNSYQMVLVRCHGRGGGATPPSRYHVDTQANYEFIYSTDSVVNKFHTNGVHDPRFGDVATGFRLGASPDMAIS